MHVFEERFGQAGLGHPSLAVLIHGRGPKWQDGVPFGEQPGVEQHVAFMRSLEALGLMVLGGPFLDSTGGMAILEAPLDHAKRLAEQDPSVTAGLLTANVRPWMTVSGRSR